MRIKKKQKQTATPEPIDPITPVVMIGATWLATQLAESVYKAFTGKRPPKADDPEAKLIQVAIWTAAVTGIVTLAESAVTRLFKSDKEN